MFTGWLKKDDMEAFRIEAEKQGVSRISLLRIWIKKAALKHPKPEEVATRS
jgi:hypothetical protein